jgi:putative PIN family toxin of toxin-antitoxin system
MLWADADDDIIYDIAVLRLVIDTDVMVAALDSPSGASRQLLLDVLDGKATLLLSTALMVEYEATLTRPRALDMIGLDAAEVLSVLDELAALCVPVGFDYQWRPMARDPDDDFVVETAINGFADVIATFNVRDMAAGAAQFGIAVERPGAVLRRIRG